MVGEYGEQVAPPASSSVFQRLAVGIADVSGGVIPLFDSTGQRSQAKPTASNRFWICK